jgi:hypothetical protein
MAVQLRHAALCVGAFLALKFLGSYLFACAFQYGYMHYRPLVFILRWLIMGHVSEM